VITAAAWVGLSAAAVFAVGDWVAKARASTALEYACKPLTMVALVVAALGLEPVDSSQRTWFVVALVLSMAGDIFLMLPEREVGPADTFTFGLGSFLLGHLAYIAGFAARGLDSPLVLVAVVGALAIIAVIAPKIVRGARREAPALGIAVTAYITVIVAMLLSAWSSGVPAAAAGSVLFVASDAMIGWSRFVRRFAGHELAIIVTYHVAQALLVISLATN
jgi:uncharacterized membrane protein YhhN